LQQAKCDEWIKRHDGDTIHCNKPAGYWLEQFTLLNKDILHGELQDIRKILTSDSLSSRQKQMKILKELGKRECKLSVRGHLELYYNY